MGWAVKLERESFRVAFEEALTEPGATLDAQKLWERLTAHLKGKRAWIKARDDAADIGTAAHDIIHWHTRRMLGLDAGPEPSGPDASMRAVCAWLDWARDVDFQPQLAERVIYCPQCAYAGALDAYGKVQGHLTLVDLKTGRAVYREAHLQVAAYKHALQREGFVVDGALILRLPKTAADPEFEPVPAKIVPHAAFRHVAGAWRTVRWLDGEETGSQRMSTCKVLG
jgi:hypothetical protein